MSDPLAAIASRYANYAMTPDGIPEINSLTNLPFEADYPPPSPAARLALVLIEPRLLDSAGDGALRGDLLRRLRRFKGDLRAEGLHSRLLFANVYRGPVHKDGRTVLALRRFFREVRATFSRFEGAIFIGNFPEATLVRRVAWCPGSVNPRQLVIGPELISERSDIVMSDLNGYWEYTYKQSDFDAQELSALPDAATTARGWFDGESVRDCEFTSSEFTVRQSPPFRDAFYLNDVNVGFTEHSIDPPRLRLQLFQEERNSEVYAEDRASVNILAKPEIVVSRINAYHVAVNPDPNIRGSDGRPLLDATGAPQAIQSATPLFNTGTQWEALFTYHNFDFERRLLIDYFDRNHRYRIGAYTHLPFQAAVVSGTTDFNPDRYESLLAAAAPEIRRAVKQPRASLVQYAEFLRTPAVLKYIMAHSDPRHSVFDGDYEPSALAASVGGPPARWIYRNGRHEPSFEGLGHDADLFLHRALWQHRALASAGACVMIHGGCNVNSVYETQDNRYHESRYARWSNAEGLLFYTNAVALFSRAKGFNDMPSGFADGFRLGDRANVGSCYKTYFNAQSNDPELSSYNIQRKRAYFWSISGDFSVRLRNRPGFALLAHGDASLETVATHPNQAWVDDWNFDATGNHIRGIGDVDGDGRDEFVVTSDWGIGILKYDGHHFRCPMAAPRDTWFGGWRNDATINPERDRIVDVRDIGGTGKCDILVASSWGLASLEYAGATLYPTRIHQYGTRLGDWLLTGDDRYHGCGRFDETAQDALVITSPWGLGLVSLARGSHLFMAPDGSRLGDWSLGVGTNSIGCISDFDGDGMDEILISSAWGIGVLKLVGGALKAIAMYANGSSIDGYTVSNAHRIACAGKLRGTASEHLVVNDGANLHILELRATGLARLATIARGERVDGWLLDMQLNEVQAAGDLDGDGRGELLIRSGWGLGVLRLDDSARFSCRAMSPHGSKLGDWPLESGDRIVGVGNFAAHDRSELLVVKRRSIFVVA